MNMLWGTAFAETALAATASSSGDLLSMIIMLVFRGIFWGFVSKAVGKHRTRKNPFVWGFFLGLIGLIVVFASDYRVEESKIEKLEKLMVMKENGSITEDEYNELKRQMINDKTESKLFY